MSASAHVVGFRPADEQWKKMKAAWDACEAAGIDLPKEVLEFFDGEEPGDKPGAEVDLGGSCRKWEDEYRHGYEIDVQALPEGLRYLRFYISW